MGSEELADLYYRTCEAADVLHAQAAELLGMAERLEELTRDSDAAWYAGTRARIEAKSALEQAEEPRWGSS